MSVPQSSGLRMLMQQRLERKKRLDGLTMSEYIQEMEKIRNGEEPSAKIKKYMLASYR